MTSEFMPWEKYADMTMSPKEELEEIERQKAEAKAIKEKAQRERIELIDDQWKSCGVGERFLNSRLTNYVPKDAGQEKALSFCMRSVKYFKNGEGVLLVGDPKGGKTHLLCGMIREALEQSLSVRYITVERFYTQLRGCMSKGTAEDDYIQSLVRPKVLALDDLFCVAAAKSSSEESYQYRMLWHLLDERYQNARATICSTNRPLNEFKEMLDERTTRRLSAKICVVPAIKEKG